MAKQQKAKIALPDWVDPDDREEIAEAIVEFIRDRTETGVGVKATAKGFRKRVFADYTDEYSEWKGSSRVDLRLSDEMLDELKVLKVGKAVEIGFDDPSLYGKVEGNRLGTYGKKKPIPGKDRDFLGITQADLDLILDPYKPRRRKSE
jgi:hypothetical protein